MRFRQHSCGQLNSIEDETCARCEQEINRPPGHIHAIAVFPSGYWEHVSADGAYIRGKADLRAITRETGMISPYAEGA